jgi:hypothetical protein
MRYTYRIMWGKWPLVGPRTWEINKDGSWGIKAGWIKQLSGGLWQVVLMYNTYQCIINIKCIIIGRRNINAAEQELKVTGVVIERY